MIFWFISYSNILSIRHNRIASIETFVIKDLSPKKKHRQCMCAFSIYDFSVYDLFMNRQCR